MLSLDAKKVTKDSLRREFSKHPKEYYSTRLFQEKGFKRQRCAICGKYFWSIAETNNCGDSVHTPYSFFRENPNRISYAEFWKKFAGFFKKNKHAIVKRYPVVSRWRQDLYFTIAGIQDFQRIENGLMNWEYGANPLLVPQPCLRFKDIENAGVTGDHFTSFMMANQTAFNYPREGYWRDRTIDLNFSFLTKVMGIAEDEINYTEDVWSMPDFSEFGPTLEFFSKGVELGNNVFTQFELAGGRIRELDNKVVDAGWGFERELWFYTGLSNAYEATFSQTIGKIKKETGLEFDTELYRRFAQHAGSLNRDEVSNIAQAEKRILELAKISAHDYERKIKPVQAVYAILDHTRTLLFAVTDGALPSNVGGGYNLRVLLRRSLDFISKYGFRISLPTLAGLIAQEMHGIYPELSARLDTFEKAVDVERVRYERAREGARRAVELLLNRGNGINAERLRRLYESNGATPDLISSVAESKGIKIAIPENAYTDIVKGDMAAKERRRAVDIDLPGSLPKTKALYYDFVSRATAKVLFAHGKYFVLDRTPFYPEGGGQVADTGKVDGIKVVEVQRINNVIVHVADGDAKLKKGQRVEAAVDEERRNAIVAHHTATHLISAAARKVLGEHAWQEGAKKEPHKAHIDIAHYDKLSDSDVRAIETMVNAWLFGGIRVGAREMSRSDAERRYGFSIYQGHGVPAKTMRIVTIHSKAGRLIDAEACGGIHAIGRENLLGMVNIIGTSRISDGIDRIEFVAGPAALRRTETMYAELGKISSALNADPLTAAKKLEELQQENRAMHKLLEKSSEHLANSIAESIEDREYIEKEVDVDRKMMIKIADMLVKRNNEAVVLLRNEEGYVICMVGPASQKNAAEVLDSALKGKKFSGGGSKRFAEAKLETK